MFVLDKSGYCFSLWGVIVILDQTSTCCDTLRPLVELAHITFLRIALLDKLASGTTNFSPW